jgi:hypothetical protein
MRIAGILAATALSLAALHGHARGDTARAWAAARAGLPADAKFVFGLDVAALQKTQLFATFYPKLREDPSAAQKLDAVKALCKLDPVAIIQGVVVGMSSDQQAGAAYVAIGGVDRAKLSSCLQLVFQAGQKDIKISIKQAGNVTEITRGSETAYLGWIGKDVIVVSLHAEDKPSLVKWMGGKGALAKADLGKTLAKVNTAAAMWGAGEGDKEIEPGITLHGGYGAVTYAKGNVSADVHAAMTNPDEATKMAASVNSQLGLLKHAPQLSPEVVAVLTAVTIAADKDQVRIQANLGEKDLLAALAFAAGNFGGP